MVTNVLVGLCPRCLVSDGAQAVVDGDCLDCSVRSILEADIGTVSTKTKFNLTSLSVVSSLAQPPPLVMYLDL